MCAARHDFPRLSSSHLFLVVAGFVPLGRPPRHHAVFVVFGLRRRLLGALAHAVHADGRFQVKADVRSEHIKRPEERHPLATQAGSDHPKVMFTIQPASALSWNPPDVDPVVGARVVRGVVRVDRLVLCTAVRQTGSQGE
jgi:hypothetical protein